MVYPKHVRTAISMPEHTRKTAIITGSARGMQVSLFLGRMYIPDSLAVAKQSLSDLRKMATTCVLMTFRPTRDF